MASSEQLKFLLRFLKYWLTAVNAHSLHPPFVYRFYNQVIGKARSEPIIAKVDQLRNRFSQDNSHITVNDLGAGSVYSSSEERKVSEIVKTASSEKKLSRLLYQCGTYLKAKQVLELGTSLGLTTQYLAKIGEDARIDTFEGSPAIYELANQHLKDRNNVHCHLGPIDELLPKYLLQVEHIDLAYLDANHTFEATMRYTEMLLPKMLPSSILVIGDIHWSEGMEQAWNKLKSLNEVTLTIDLFHCGLLFFLPVRDKQNYILSF